MGEKLNVKRHVWGQLKETDSFQDLGVELKMNGLPSLTTFIYKLYGQF
jgi:hypothetical protein